MLSEQRLLVESTFVKCSAPTRSQLFTVISSKGAVLDVKTPKANRLKLEFEESDIWEFSDRVANEVVSFLDETLARAR